MRLWVGKKVLKFQILGIRCSLLYVTDHRASLLYATDHRAINTRSDAMSRDYRPGRAVWC